MSANSHNTSKLLICPWCFEVYGAVEIEGVAYKQTCSCRPRGPGQNPKPAPGADYATYVELCRACGLEAVSSGSRWSRYFCPDCHESIRGLNRRLGFALIPIGRHSIMNSFSLSGKDIDHQEKVDAFVRGLQGMFFRSDALHDWRRLMVARRCAELGFESGKPIPLAEFQLKAQGADREGIRKTSIRKLFAFFEVPEVFIRSGSFQESCRNQV